MGKQIRKTNISEAFNLSDAHIHDVLAQSKITGEPLVIYKGEDGALYSDNGRSLWRVVDEKSLVYLMVSLSFVIELSINVFLLGVSLCLRV